MSIKHLVVFAIALLSMPTAFGETFKTVETAEECARLVDSTTRVECMAAIGNGDGFKVRGSNIRPVIYTEYQPAVDTTTTITINGEDTTKVVTINRSVQKENQQRTMDRALDTYTNYMTIALVLTVLSGVLTLMLLI